MRKEFRRNRLFWDWQTHENIASGHYDAYWVRRRGSSLHGLEIREVGPVRGKRLLHLQCNIGADSISWALRGAKVTAVDFSPEALTYGRRLAEEKGAKVEFVESNVYDLPRKLGKKAGFDIVFTSYGVLYWLPDLRRWARVAAHFLRRGGTFYIVEHHPIAQTYGDRTYGDGKSPVYPYCHGKVPLVTKLDGNPGAAREPVRRVMHYAWIHPLGEVVDSLIGAGMRIEHVREFPFSDFPQFEGMRRTRDRMWRMPQDLDKFPMTYSIRATKPGDPRRERRKHSVPA